MSLEAPSFVGRYSFCLPVFDELSKFLAESRSLQGAAVGWHCHLTEITACAASVLVKAGARLYMSECNRQTTSQPALAYMQALGAEVYTGAGSLASVLAKKPQVLSDTGGELVSAYISDLLQAQTGSPRPRASSKTGGACGFPLGYVFGASEITASGITRLRSLASLPLPVIDINGGQLKTFIENFHGVGSGVIEALNRLTGRMLAGRGAAVIGYGRVGAGCSHYLQRQGASVTVVETDPVRALTAHYDGFQLRKLKEALETAEFVVSATGCPGVVGAADWPDCRDGAVIVNVGHWGNELDIDSLRNISTARKVQDQLEEFSFQQKHVYIAANGAPVNVAMLTGSAEPTLIHLTTELICMNYLTQLLAAGKPLEPGLLALPPEIERLSSQLALQALHSD